MKKLLLLFTIIFLISSTVKSQTLTLFVTDSVYTEINDYKIYRNDSIQPFLNSNQYQISVKSGDKIKIVHEWYVDTTFQITEKLVTSDTLSKYIFLKSRVQNIGEVIVTNKKYQLIFDNENEFIVDYYPMPVDNLLFITKHKNNFYLKLISEDNDKIKELSLSFKPINLNLDQFGNFHLFSKDSVFQIWITEKDIQLVNGTSVAAFKKT